ncbi:MAG: DNA-methyltransferase [Pseudomonas piscis]|uniref:DNA-methyltransferase n=1 Tax=Pseudomonas piscis TaxID=2614538 RepID=UPI003D2B2B9A
MSEYQLYLGDCLEQLRLMPDNSVDSVVTDPPYGLSFMGKKWDYDVPAVEVWVECLRVLKPGGHLLSFAAARTYHHMAVGIEMAGFEIRDQIMWVFGSGFPKSHNLKGDRAGWGTALKPAHEPICMARKPLAGTVEANVLAHSTGALNIDGCRVGNEVISTHSRGSNGAFPKRPGETSAEESGRKKDQRNGLDHSERTGRWPANLIHDGSPEVVALFPAEAGASAPVKGTEESRASVGIITGERARVVGAFHGDSGSAARFFYCPKTSRRDRNEGCEAMKRKPLHWSSGDANPGSFQSEGTDKTSQNNHPTVKPTDLMAYLLRLVTPPGGTALDPFMGSGSTGKAAMREGFRFIGCELDEQYAAIARARIEHELAKPKQLQL